MDAGGGSAGDVAYDGKLRRKGCWFGGGLGGEGWASCCFEGLSLGYWDVGVWRGARMWRVLGHGGN